MSEDRQPAIGRVLVVAGSDSGGGAGIQADIKTITMLGGYAATAITALTIQNTQGVSGIVPAPIPSVTAQMIAVLSDIGADIIKTGMLGDKKLIEAIAQTLSDYAKGLPRVIDPVMVSTAGDKLLPPAAIDTLRAVLIPKAIITPNAPEAGLLTKREVFNLDGQRRAAERLLEDGAYAAIVKGGHIEGDTIIDLIATPEGEIYCEHERISGTSTHGTGCTLASATATGLAQGLKLEDAFKRAQVYVAQAIKYAPNLGKGHGPLGHEWPVRHPELADNLLNKFKASK